MLRSLSLLSLLALATPLAAQANLRAWSEHGQTWLVWEDSAGLGLVPGGTDTYSVYRSDVPIADVTTATLAGRFFAHDWHAGRLKLSAGAAATFSIPDGAGGTYALAADEAVMAYTSHGAGPEHFAVVKTGEVVPPAGATAGPVAPSTERVVPHAQHGGVDGGHDYTVYAIWIDGHGDHGSGTDEFPVMGNEHFNGTAQLFAVFEPILGLPPAPYPAAVFLHGGKGSYWKFRPSNSAGVGIDLDVTDGVYVTVDDNLHVYSDHGGGAPFVYNELKTRWFGYCEGYDRFESMSVVPPDDSLVVDYTLRRVDFVLDWLVESHDVDEHRVGLSGLSNGGRGTMSYVRTRPERIAAATCFVQAMPPAVVPVPAPTGTIAQDLATNLPGGVGIWTFLHPSTDVLGADLPFMRMIWGTNDTQVAWGLIPALMGELNDLRWGAHTEWDERGHTASAGWAGAHFAGSPRHDPQALTGFRNDQSFPAFFDVDHDLVAAGEQPEPTAPPGVAHGSMGGWLRWDPTSIVDSAVAWEVDLSVVSGAAFAGDNAPAPDATASVMVRRPQQFLLAPFQTFEWRLRDVGAGLVLQSGVAVADADGRAAVTDLELDTGVARLELTAIPSSWTPLGQGLGGALGVPVLGGKSSMQPGSSLQLSLQSAPPSASAWLAVGTSQIDLPVLGGTLVPAPTWVLPRTTSALGEADWSTAMPPGAAPGLELVFQAWVADPTGPMGFVASDGLLAIAL